MEKLINLIKDLFSVNQNVAVTILICLLVILLAMIVTIIILSIKVVKSKKEIDDLYYQIDYLTKKDVLQNEEIDKIIDEKVANILKQKEEETKEIAEETKEPIGTKKTVKKVEKAKGENNKIIGEEAKEENIQNSNTDTVSEETKEDKEEKTPVKVLTGKYEIFHVKDLFLYRLKASNGEIMIVSELYKTEKGALSAVETLKKNIETGTIQIYKDKHDLYQFKLFASNKRLMATSANYTTQQACESAANSFKRFAMVSPVITLEEDPEQIMEEVELNQNVDKKGGKIFINELGDDIYEFKVVASNGVVLCTSSEYKTKTAAINGINVFKEAIKNGRFIVVKDKNNMYQFKLYTTAGRCIVVGEAYKNKTQAASAANSVTSFINMAEVIEKGLEEIKVIN